MNLDELNAQNQQPNDEQLQQIRASRKLLGGIIKKGNTFQSILNIVLLIILLPIMFIQELYYGIIALMFYLKDKTLDFIDFSQRSFIAFLQWIHKTYIQISIKFRTTVKIVYKAVKQFILIIAQLCKVVWKKIRGVYITIKKIVLDQLDKMYLYLAVKFTVCQDVCTKYLEVCKNVFVKYFLIIFYAVLKQFKAAKNFAIRVIKIIWNYTTQKLEQFWQFLKIQVKKLCILLKKISIFCTNQLIKFYQFLKANLIIPLAKLLQQFCQFTNNKLLQFWKYLKECLIKLKNKLIEFLIFSYDKLIIFSGWAKIQLNLLKQKTYQLLVQLKDKLIDFTLYCIDKLITFCQNLQKKVVSPTSQYIKQKFTQIFDQCKRISIILFDCSKASILALNSKLVTLKKKMFKGNKRVRKFLYHLSKNFKEKLQDKLIVISKFATEKGTILNLYLNVKYQILKQFLKYCSKAAKQKFLIFQQFAILTLIVGKNNASNWYFRTRQFFKLIYKSMRVAVKKFYYIIKKTIKLILELICKLIIKFFLVFKTFEIIITFTETILEYFFSFILTFQKILEYFCDFGIKIHFVHFPKFVCKICSVVYYIGSKICKQTKKVITIIRNKIIYPIIYVGYMTFKSVQYAYGIIVQKLKNIYGMIKYDYVLPAWASIRLFGVKVKHLSLQVINFIKQKYIEIKKIVIYVFNKIKTLFVGIIKYLVGQFIIAKTLIVNQFIMIRNYLVGQIIKTKNYIILQLLVMSQFLKAQYNLLKQQLVIFIQTIMKPIIELKKQIQIQFMILRQKVQDLINSIKESIIHLKNEISNSITMTINIIKHQANQVKQVVIIKKNEISLSVQIMGQNIKQQMIQQKQNLIQLKNDTFQTIKQMFKRN